MARSGERPSASPAPARQARRPSEFVRWLVAGPGGEAHEVTPDDYARCPVFDRPEPVCGVLRQFVSNELGAATTTTRTPAHIGLMRRHELVDYCDASEKGHLKWYPKGVLIQRLLLDYAAEISTEWGAVEVRNPLVIRGDHNAVGELMGEFHERDYRVDGGRGTCYLRYASDPLAFPFLQTVRFSHRQTPLRVYEETLCFRNEQEGEVGGLRRVRSFLMTDMHAACADEVEARADFDWLCRRFARLLDGLVGPDRWVLGWEGTVEFFEANRDWLLGIGRELAIPAFFKLMPRMGHYYAMKNEFQCITGDGANIQTGTVQWDVKDGARFDIGYVDADGRKVPCPVILHASSFGSVERGLCALLEAMAARAEAGGVARWPLWLAPTQVRLVPVSDAHVALAEQVRATLADAAVRADLDDRNETVGHRVALAEREWVPFVVVLGDREAAGAPLSVRERGAAGADLRLHPRELAGLVRERTAGMPTRPLPLPARLSGRPIFFG